MAAGTGSRSRWRVSTDAACGALKRARCPRPVRPARRRPCTRYEPWLLVTALTKPRALAIIHTVGRVTRGPSAPLVEQQQSREAPAPSAPVREREAFLFLAGRAMSARETSGTEEVTRVHVDIPHPACPACSPALPVARSLR